MADPFPVFPRIRPDQIVKTLIAMAEDVDTLPESAELQAFRNAMGPLLIAARNLYRAGEIERDAFRKVERDRDIRSMFETMRPQLGKRPTRKSK